MGGYGSGRRVQFGKDTVSDLKSIDIRKLQREGWLKQSGQIVTLTWRRGGRVTGDIKLLTAINHLTLVYRVRGNGEEWEDKKYDVAIDRTACHYGGSRVWFRCPCCNKRVAELYGGKVFACRHCHNLAYDSQRENKHDRLARKADKIRERLGWEGGILNGHGWKPKGMHWKTFERLQVKHHLVEEKIYTIIKAYLDKGVTIR